MPNPKTGKRYGMALSLCPRDTLKEQPGQGMLFVQEFSTEFMKIGHSRNRC
jgi:hypothetical protein